MTDKQAHAIRAALADNIPASWVDEALAHAADVPLEGDEEAQADTLVRTIAAVLRARVDALNAEVRAKQASNAAMERWIEMDDRGTRH